ncbi:MAG: lipoate--protein ligase family protein [Actinobacteria bacterium]|nr:MAG: lipoate--protein ligase family protein [Actinomycetota bacterium]
MRSSSQGKAASRAWRLIDGGDRSGARNMAIDLALLRLHLAGQAPPTLHVYGWQPEAVSLGSKQDASQALDLDRCRLEGIDAVRRPTGGRAVFHSGDFTFSFIASSCSRIPPGVNESYATICRIVATALRALGVVAATGERGRPSRRSAACFASSTVADLAVDGRKLVGGAQRWERNAFLQQNSLLVVPEPGRAFRYIRPPRGKSVTEASEELAAEVCGLAELMGELPERARIVEALATGLEETLEVAIVPGELSREEIALARILLESGGETAVGLAGTA